MEYSIAEMDWELKRKKAHLAKLDFTLIRYLEEAGPEGTKLTSMGVLTEDPAVLSKEGKIRFDNKATVYAEVQDKELLIKTIQDNALELEFLKTDLQMGELNELARKNLKGNKAFFAGMGFRTQEYISRTPSIVRHYNKSRKEEEGSDA